MISRRASFLSIIILGSLFVALPLFGAEGEYQPVPFRLYSIFQYEPSASIQKAMRDEVNAIMEPLGWKFEWDSLDEASGQLSMQLVVVHFKGMCGANDLTEFGPYQFVLGRTEISHREILSFADIYCDAIRAYLATDLLAKEPEDRNAAFGRAVGRVVAHELYHILGNTTHHASKGLGKACYKPQELLADGFRFETKEVVKLRAEAGRALGRWKGSGGLNLSSTAKALSPDRTRSPNPGEKQPAGDSRVEVESTSDIGSPPQ